MCFSPKDLDACCIKTRDKIYGRYKDEKEGGKYKERERERERERETCSFFPSFSQKVDKKKVRLLLKT